MNNLQLKSKAEKGWDLVSLGEILLRFDPEDQRIQTTRSFTVWDGGAEYNVAKNLSKVFRQKTAIVSALANNALGRLAEDFVFQSGVDASEILWREDGNSRNGLYFIERGFGLRVPNFCFDRANTAVSQLKTGEIDWQKIFDEKGGRWFHTGGIFAGLSETAPHVALEAMKTARENGAIVSYDLNYRESLWKNRGGKPAANKINRELLPFADVVFGVFDYSPNLSEYEENTFRKFAEKMQSDFPNLKIIVSTLRKIYSASRHDVCGVCYADGEVYKAKDYKDIEVLDRVGSGDAFASGFIYGLLNEKDLRFSIECGAAHGALAMTSVGDNSMATLDEVLSLMSGEGASVKR